MYSQEYLASIAIIVVSVLKYFGIEIGSDTITTFLTAALAIYVAIRRYQKKDITVLGVKK